VVSFAICPLKSLCLIDPLVDSFIVPYIPNHACQFPPYPLNTSCSQRTIHNTRNEHETNKIFGNKGIRGFVVLVLMGHELFRNIDNLLSVFDGFGLITIAVGTDADGAVGLGKTGTRRLLLEVIVFDTRVISCPLRLVRTDEKVLLTCELWSRRNEVTRIAETLQNRFNFIRGDAKAFGMGEDGFAGKVDDGTVIDSVLASHVFIPWDPCVVSLGHGGGQFR